MSGDLEQIGRRKRREFAGGLLKFGAVLFILWNLVDFVRIDFWEMTTPQTISLVVVLMVSGPLVSLWYRERGPLLQKAKRGVFLDGAQVVVRGALGETRMPLAAAIAQHTKSEIGSEEFIDGEHRAWEHDLRITDSNYPASGSIKVDIGGMTGVNVGKYAEQLNRDLADARWRYRLPAPETDPLS